MEMPIIGRDRELAELRADLVTASCGTGRMVLISGEQGIGKTRLVSAIEDMAGEYGVPAVHGHAIDDPGRPPLWPWQRLIPALTDAIPAEAVDDAAAARFLMFARVSQALADAAAARGLVVILEDLQWADQTSLLLLRHLAGELARTRLLVAATFREPADQPLTSLLGTGLSAGRVRHVRLSGLSRPDIGRWLLQVGAAGDIDEQAGRLRERTGGNPLFIPGCPPPKSAPCSTTPSPRACCTPRRIPRACRSRTPWSGTWFMTSWRPRSGWRCMSGPPWRWNDPGTARSSQARSPATGGDPADRTGPGTACGGPVRRRSSRRSPSPTTRPPGSPPSRWRLRKPIRGARACSPSWLLRQPAPNSRPGVSRKASPAARRPPCSPSKPASPACSRRPRW